MVLSHVTYRHERFSDLVDVSFSDVQSKATLVRHWLDSRAGIILITCYRPFPGEVPKMDFVNGVDSCKAKLFFYPRDWEHCYTEMSTLYSAAPLIGDFLRQFKTVGWEQPSGFGCVLRFHNGKAQFYITKLELFCDDHARLFTETITISTPSRPANLCSKQSCLKFLRSLVCFFSVNEQNFKDLGADIRNCKHLKEIHFFLDVWYGLCELLDQVPNLSTCSSSSCSTDRDRLRFLWDLDPRCEISIF